MSADFVFGGISIGGAAGGSATPGVPTEWPVNQTTGVVAQITPDPQVDTQSSPFNFVGGSFDFSGTENFVVRLGHNIGQGGVSVDADRPMVASEWEQDFLTGGNRYAEHHLAHRGDFVGSTLRRPITYFLRNDDEPANDSQYSVDFGVRQITQTWDGDVLFRSNTVNGVQAFNVPLGTSHTDVAVSHLNLAGPAGQTAPFVTFSRNAAELGRLTALGELVLTGATGGTVSSESAMFKVVGRTGTAAIITFATAGGTTRLEIDQTEGSTGQLRSAGQWYHSGQFAVRSNVSVTTGFLVAPTGVIYTNQTSAGGPAGAVVGKMPIYNTSFALVGYIEIKALS